MTEQELIENYIKIRDAAFAYEREIRSLKEQIEEVKTVTDIYNRIKIVKLPKDKDVCDLKGQINEFYFEIR